MSKFLLSIGIFLVFLFGALTALSYSPSLPSSKELAQK